MIVEEARHGCCFCFLSRSRNFFILVESFKTIDWVGEENMALPEINEEITPLSS
jgi:hypothetical protein